jgi:hypothetical protein
MWLMKAIAIQIGHVLRHVQLKHLPDIEDLCNVGDFENYPNNKAQSQNE